MHYFNNDKKKIFLLFAFLTSFVISLIAAFSIIENYFFDKVFYKKSIIHGYVKKYYDLNFNSIFHYQRIQDLKSLHQQEEKNNKFLKLPKEKKEYTIAIIGDSFAYGVGIRNSQRFSVVLEKKLKKIKPTKIYSFALSGDNFLSYYTNYKLIDKYIQPDLFIITMVENDFIMDQLYRYPDSKNNFNFLTQDCGDNIYIPTWTDTARPWFELGWTKIVNNYSYPSAINPTNICIVKTALSKFNQDKTLYLTMTPFESRSTHLNKQSSLERNEAVINIRKIMTDYIKIINDCNGDVLIVNPVTQLDIPIEKIEVSKNEGHYSAESNLFIADKLLTEITSNKKWGFEQK